jgi:hypothetical protein
VAGPVVAPGAAALLEVGERLTGRQRGRVVLQGDEAVLVLEQEPAAGWDGVVEGVGEFVLFGGLDDDQAGVEAVLVEVAGAVVDQPSRVTWSSSSASSGSRLWL